jgi:hypothetical protein
MNTKRRRHRTRRTKNTLQKKAQKGFRGYPIATIACYGPDTKFASKVAVGIILEENGEVAFLERWFSQAKDVRTDPTINREIAEFIDRHQVKSVGMTDSIIGCPHEEGIDYPVEENCPECPYWANRDRWTGELIGEDQEAQEVEAVTGCAWYRAEQWGRLREISADRDKLHETYEEWAANAEKSLQEMRKVGVCIEKVEIDVEELLSWCRAPDREVNGEARSQYAGEMLHQRQTIHNEKSVR